MKGRLAAEAIQHAVFHGCSLKVGCPWRWPLSPVIARVVGGVLITAGNYEQGMSVCKQLAQENPTFPTFPIAHDCLFYAYWGTRIYPQAVEERKIYAQLTGSRDDAETASALERGLQSGGWPGALTQNITLLENRRKNKKGYASPFDIARLYADRGDKDQAFAWLDTAYREHDSLLIGLNVQFQFNSIRADSRFAAMANKMGLPKAE